MDEIVGRFLSREESQPSEDDLIAVIDRKYKGIHMDVLYLKRSGYNQKQIQRILGIGEISYLKAVAKLKERHKWKEYRHSKKKELVGGCDV